MSVTDSRIFNLSIFICLTIAFITLLVSIYHYYGLPSDFYNTCRLVLCVFSSIFVFFLWCWFLYRSFVGSSSRQYYEDQISGKKIATSKKIKDSYDTGILKAIRKIGEKPNDKRYAKNTEGDKIVVERVEGGLYVDANGNRYKCSYGEDCDNNPDQKYVNDRLAMEGATDKYLSIRNKNPSNNPFDPPFRMA